jgi:hypothetical protein
MPLGEVVFKRGAVMPEHKDKVVAKLGTTFEFVIVTKVVKLVAH